MTAHCSLDKRDINEIPKNIGEAVHQYNQHLLGETEISVVVP
jgi:hypothetical protein